MVKKPSLSFMLGILIYNSHAAFAQSYSTNMNGNLGLNKTPSARMDTVGTIRTQAGFIDPYFHGFVGLQLAAPLYLGLKQNVEFSSFDKDAKSLSPSLNAKLRIKKESAYIPEVVFGINSELSQNRQSGEYIALSKRYKSFDITGGLGWGRYAAHPRIENPLKTLGSHFDKNRNTNITPPNKPDEWLTGQHMGFFAGLEYFTPVKGLSLKADLGGDEPQLASLNQSTSNEIPWSFGLNYKPWDFIDLGIATYDSNKLLARLSLQNNIKNWKHRSAQKRKLSIPAKDNETSILHYSANHSAPYQIGQAAHHLNTNTQEPLQAFQITPVSLGLKGPSLTLIRDKIGQSSDEQWHTTEIKHNFSGFQKPATIPSVQKGLLDALSFTLDNSFSLSEDDTSFLRRTSFIAKAQKSGLLKYFTAGLGLRLNLSDNLGKLRRTRPQRVFPIKSDAPDFADRFAALDTGYAAFTHTLMPDTHISAIGGYLDENFFGMGGEILYRPHNARFAIGAEGWTVNKRNPFSTLNLKTRTGNLASAHINAWYDIPEADITLGIKTGRYLAEDFGATLSLTKNFKNGAKLEGFMTISDEDDTNGFQGRTHTNQGLRLSLPLGGYKYTPNSDVKITAEPFGRDIGQTITNPTPLYEVSEPFSTAHTTRHWDEINKHTKN